jgi:hypothetical protein
MGASTMLEFAALFIGVGNNNQRSGKFWSQELTLFIF